MATQRLAGIVVLGLLAQQAAARINATSAFQVLAITECEECTTDPDSISCTAGSGYITNATMPKTYVKTDAKGTPVEGEFCWEGTFGAMLNYKGNFTQGILGSRGWIYADLECPGMSLYYRQCIINADTATILFVIGSIVFVSVVSWCCICFGLCKCGHKDNELQCCYLMTCETVKCCAPAVEVSTRIENLAVAQSLTGKADDAKEEKPKSKLSAKQRLALRIQATKASKEGTASSEDAAAVANPMNDAADESELLAKSVAP